MHTGSRESIKMLMSRRLCSCEAECEEKKAVFMRAASLRTTFSSTSSRAAHPGSQVSWNPHKMKSNRACRDYWKKAPNQRARNKYRLFKITLNLSWTTKHGTRHLRPPTDKVGQRKNRYVKTTIMKSTCSPFMGVNTMNGV